MAMLSIRVRRYEAITERREPILCDCGTLIGWIVYRNGRFHRVEISQRHHGQQHTVTVAAEQLQAKAIDSA